MIHAEDVQNRRMQIVDVHAVLDREVTVVIGRAVSRAALHAGARHPHRVAVRIVVAAIAALGDRRAPEFAAPNDQRVLQQPVRLQVGQQPVDRLVHLEGGARMQPDQLAVRIPTNFVAGPVLMRDLDEPHIALREPPRHQALPGEVARFRVIEAVQFPGRVGLFGNVERLRRLGLHPESELESLDAGLKLRVMIPAIRALAVHLLQHVQLVSLLLGRERFILQVFNRLAQVLDVHASVSDGGALISGRKEAGAPVFAPPWDRPGFSVR